MQGEAQPLQLTSMAWQDFLGPLRNQAGRRLRGADKAGKPLVEKEKQTQTRQPGLFLETVTSTESTLISKLNS